MNVPENEDSEGLAAFGLPSVEDLIAEAEAEDAEEASEQQVDEETFDTWFNEDYSVKTEMAYAHLRGVQDHYDNKSRWSNFLMCLLGGMIGFQWILLGLVGAGCWDFSKYQWLLPILLVQNLGQIIGLAYVVVRSLFKDIAPKD